MNKDDLDDEEFDDEEEEEDEDYEDEAKLSGKRSKHHHKKSKKKRNKRRKERSNIENLLDVAADEGDEEESVDDYEAELNQAEAAKEREEMFKKRDRQHYRIENVFNGNLDPAEYAGDLEEANRPVDLDNIENKEIIKQCNLPTAQDPSLWFVKCKNGSEKLSCISLLNKAAFKKKQKQPLLILSVTYLENIKGHVYIEAYKEAHVRQAIEGLQCFGNKVTLVPLNEMNEVYTITHTKKKNLTENDFVRIKSGLYSGDLGVVVDANYQMTKVKVKIVPRLEFEDIHLNRPQIPDAKNKRSKKNSKIVRPPPKLFNNVQYNCTEIKIDPQTNKEFYYWGGMNFRNGFLYKYFSIRQLKTEDVNPTLSELQMFHDDGSKSEEDEKIDLALIKEKQSSKIVKGDKVRVVKGELKELTGTVTSINDLMVTMAPISDKIKGPLNFPVTDLEKYFQEGDYVRVAHGQNKGESGLVTYVENGMVFIYSDTKRQEIEVRASDIQSGSDVKPLQSDGHNYRANDLIVFNNNKSAGVILSVMCDSVNVLDTYGDNKVVRLQDINARRDSRRITALDSMRNSIAVGDLVRIIDGENKSRRGTIVHIYKDYIFLFGTDQSTNNGLFVERRRNLLILGAEMLHNTGGPGRDRRSKMDNPRHDDLLGKQIRIQSGPYKGYLGTVTSIDKANVKVELSSKPKIINVERSSVKLASDRAEDEPVAAYEAATKTPAYPPQSPNWMASTPAPHYGDSRQDEPWYKRDNN